IALPAMRPYTVVHKLACGETISLPRERQGERAGGRRRGGSRASREGAARRGKLTPTALVARLLALVPYPAVYSGPAVLANVSPASPTTRQRPPREDVPHEQISAVCLRPLRDLG